MIIEDVRSDNYSNFRKGMDLAAAELNADVQLITLYEKLDVKEQMDLMDREQQDGTDALIVIPDTRYRELSSLFHFCLSCPRLLCRLRICLRRKVDADDGSFIRLRPVVENAIYHGMEFMDGDGEVCVKAYREADDLWFQISDNGLGMTRQYWFLLD